MSHSRCATPIQRNTPMYPIPPDAQMPGVRVPRVRRAASRANTAARPLPSRGGRHGSSRSGHRRPRRRGPCRRYFPRCTAPPTATARSSPFAAIPRGARRPRHRRRAAVAPGAVPGSAPGSRPIGREYWTPPTGSGPHVGAEGVERGPPRAARRSICIASMALGWATFNRVLDRDPLPSGTERVRGRVTASCTRRPTTRSTRSSRRRRPSSHRVDSRSRSSLGDDQPRRGADRRL